MIEGDNKLTVTYCELLTLFDALFLTDIRVDWETHNVIEGDKKLTVTYCKLLTLNDLHCFYQIFMLTGKHTMWLRVTTNL